MNISLTAGGSQNPRLVLCSEVQEHDLQAVLGKPLQPEGGDWWEDSSDYTGNLLKTGHHAYQCAIARVVIERNPAVVPSKVCQVGDHVYLRVAAPHFCGNAHPNEDGLQQLFYAKIITSTGQTEVTFESVIERVRIPRNTAKGTRFTLVKGPQMLARRWNRAARRTNSIAL